MYRSCWTFLALAGLTSAFPLYILFIVKSNKGFSAAKELLRHPHLSSPLKNPTPQFELEEYKQVLIERQFVMSRYMQAVGLYLALSGFALRELLDAKPGLRTWFLAILFSVLNIIALQVARQFRNMAAHAMQREDYLAERYHLARTSQLYWGYRAGVLLVCISEVSIAFVTASKISGWSI
jgi:hypothetical protein